MTPSLCGLFVQSMRTEVALASVAVTLIGVSGDLGPVRSPHAAIAIEVTTKPQTNNAIFFIPSCLIEF
jgi:hypothetical protein